MHECMCVIYKITLFQRIETSLLLKASGLDSRPHSYLTKPACRKSHTLLNPVSKQWNLVSNLLVQSAPNPLAGS